MTQTFVDEQIKDVDFEVKEGEILNLNFASFKAFSSFEIHAKIHSNATINVAFADLSSGKGSIKASVELLGEGASCAWRLASICASSSEKTIDVSLSHKAPHTSGVVSDYGIVQGESKLNFLGVSEIQKGAFSSSTRQDAKIIVFDEKCQGKAMPILKIDENDVAASHAAVVGKLNEQHLFYLLSRGISLPAARKLLTLGYLKPIEQYFEDEALRAKIDDIIEGGI